MYKVGCAWLLWNMAVFALYGADKLYAKKNMRRISERTLLSSAFLLGGIGALFGMVVFHHKTSKMKFRIIVPLAVICNLISGIAWLLRGNPMG